MTIIDTSALRAYRWVRPVALVSALLLFGYGVLRLLDGLDGHRNKAGWPWLTGHTLFLIGVVGFAAVMLGLRGLLRTRSPRGRTVDDLATAAGLLGTVGFAWVILGDLFPRFAEAAPPSDLVLLGGPALFELGLLVLLYRAAAARLCPVWGPVLVLVGFVAIAVNLDLLPIGAALVLAGLFPLTGTPRPVRG
ncbi:hypothetical protein [Micromonospora auratinigra]|uniref:Low temperature requirement A protein (LtrA) n=1 Tax=Micromonospora auratinigra TaxID=261654 RepID=A0A1A9A8J2_9ACTN|nr:hypothetical protein [Micromonospora auratinigra]SBT52433.1 hypothetical protein GA0070611_5633 [Micromonospora auratinigra]